MLTLKQPLFRDFCTFAKAHVESGDIDPMYPVLRAYYEAERWDEERRLWATFLYVTYYHVGSAKRLWVAHPYPRRFDATDIAMLAAPTGTERRCFRGRPDLVACHINAMYQATVGEGGMWRWVQNAVGMGGEGGWRTAREFFQGIPYGGVWSSYKWADLLKNVHGLPITANDIGVGGGSETAGPIPGMVALTGIDWKECARNVGLQRALLYAAHAEGVPFGGLDQLETSLCDFNSTMKGHYYVGHDIDDQMTKLENSGPELWNARRMSFKPKHLGEVGGWHGVRKELRSLYAEKQEVWLP